MLKTIDSVMETYINEKQVSGGVVLIARKGAIGYMKSFGMMDIKKNPTIF